MSEGINDIPMSNFEKKYDEEYFNRYQQLLEQQGLLTTKEPEENPAIRNKVFKLFKHVALQTIDEYKNECKNEYPLCIQKWGSEAENKLQRNYKIIRDAVYALSIIMSDNGELIEPKSVQYKFKTESTQSTFYWDSFSFGTDWNSVVTHIINTTVTVIDNPRQLEEYLKRKFKPG